MYLVQAYLDSSKILGEVSPRTVDLVMSVGGKLSCLFMTTLCKDRGVKAEYVDLSRIIPHDYAATGLDSSFYVMLVQAL